MRVVCDNCGASYKIPETKLVKEVNKATCRKCGHRMLIRRAGDGDGATQQMDENPYLSSVGSEDFRSAIAAASAGVPRLDIAPRSEWEEEDPTHIAQLDEHGDPIPPPPPPVPKRSAAAAAGHARGLRPQPGPAVAAPAPHPVSLPRPMAPVAAAPIAAAPMVSAPISPPAVAIHSPGPAAMNVPVPPPVSHTANPGIPAATAFDPSGDLSVIGFGVIVAAVGGLLLAVTDSGFLVRFAALFLALWGTLTSLFVVVTGSRGRRKASVILSTVLGTLFAVVGSGAVVGAKSGADALAAFSNELGAMAAAELATEAPTEAPTAPLGTLFAEEPVAEAAPDAAAAEAAPPDPAAPPEPAAPAPAAAAAPAAPPPEPKAKESTVDRQSAYVAPPSEPARGSAGSTSSATAAKATSSSSSSNKGSTSTPPPSEASTAAAGSAPKSAMTSLPPTVVDTMVKSNQSVKKCMYQEFKRADGKLGSVTVRFKVLSSGKVSSASMLSSNYKGTELDTCMTAALYTVTFPSFDGDAQSFDITLGT